MSSPDHGHESANSGWRPGCLKLVGIVCGAVFTLTVLPMETRWYYQHQEDLPRAKRDPSSLVDRAEWILRYMGRDFKELLLWGIDETRDQVEKF